MIQEALTRHKSVGNAAKAPGLSRSTLDARCKNEKVWHRIEINSSYKADFAPDQL